MEENGEVIYSVSNGTVLTLFFFLAALLVLLFFLYKYLNKEANGKYTVERIVYREGGLRDRARGTVEALGNRLGVQLWPQSQTDQDEEKGESEDEEEANSNEDSDEDDVQPTTERKSGSVVEVNSAKESSNDDDDDDADSSDEEDQAKESKTEEGKAEESMNDDVQEHKPEETSAPIVINLNQFSGSVLWSEETKGEAGDVTAL